MSKIYKEIKSCRICGSKRLTDVLDLGHQALTGVFPKPDEVLKMSPVVVCKCDHCHLVQLKHTVELSLMYGETYGYQSSLNKSMVDHLESLHTKLVNLAGPPNEGDIIVDIGSNDATFLKFFNKSSNTLIGIDPTASKFLDQYEGMIVEPDFFSAEAYANATSSEELKGRKARYVTSIACFYDLEDPIQFAKETADILTDDGIWMMEMAYLPSIIQNLCFDGFVQEHLEYYSLRDIKYIMDRAGLKIIDVELTDTNGGSFIVSVTKEDNKSYREFWRLESLLLSEHYLTLMETYEVFRKDVEKFKEDFLDLLKIKKSQGEVYGLGASTKFNVVLQYCGVGPDLITAIGEVNDYKFGRVTPGTGIPIIPEKEILDKKPHCLVVGPYHFRNSFVDMIWKRYEGQIERPLLVFPLPKMELV